LFTYVLTSKLCDWEKNEKMLSHVQISGNSELTDNLIHLNTQTFMKTTN